MSLTTEQKRQVDAEGFAIVPHVPDETSIRSLTAALCEAGSQSGTYRRESVYAIRNLMEAVPAVRALADADPLRAFISPILGPGCFPVRGLFFDKVEGANWKVPWHQDLTIAVKQRIDTPGFGPWSEKAGIPHVQPPVAVLERMLAVRLHLDDCGAANGPLRVLPGTHRYGRLSAEEIARLREERPEVVCKVQRGGALLMRPLLLHASSPAQSPSHRRVIHLEYAAEALPNGLCWYEKGEE